MLWETALVNSGHWTEGNEVWYERRLKELREGVNPRPFTESEWRSKLRGNSKKAKPIRENNQKFSLEVVNGTIHHR